MRNILAIESSCDDTSVSYIQGSLQEPIVVLAKKTISQIDIHKAFGGVIPELAGRKHAEAIAPLLEEIMKDLPIPDAIAVTAGPGLMTGLLVGIEAATTLAYLWNIPIIPINHIEGHISSIVAPTDKPKQPLSALEFPALALIASGGHTEIILMKDFGSYEKIGKTKDDAAGEAFDKIAKMLDLPYPGGPKISALAKEGNRKAIPFPRPMITDPSYDFSFSGLKTAVLYYIQEHGAEQKEDICASAEEAIVDVLAKKMQRAIIEYKPKSIILGGGVSANERLRERLKEIAEELPIYLPEKEYCMDNATMIGIAALPKLLKNEVSSWKDVEANPNWKIDAEI